MVMTVEQRVAKGAEWLDSERPGWELEIDVATLDLSNTCLCVLGQVYSAAALTCQEVHRTPVCNFDGVGSGFNWVHNHMKHQPDWMWEHGFDDLNTFAQLQPAWLSLIKERLNNGITLEGE